MALVQDILLESLLVSSGDKTVLRGLERILLGDHSAYFSKTQEGGHKHEQLIGASGRLYLEPGLAEPD